MIRTRKFASLRRQRIVGARFIALIGEAVGSPVVDIGVDVAHDVIKRLPGAYYMLVKA